LFGIALWHQRRAYVRSIPNGPAGHDRRARDKRALAIRKKALGPEHPETANSLNGLAALHRATGANMKAEPLYQRAQGINETNTALFVAQRQRGAKAGNSISVTAASPWSA
jgi:hypothetical protein